VWFDTDHDGIQDAGEKGIEGATVALVKPDGTITKTTTDANGHYIFKDLEPGKYTVYFETPAGMIPTGLNIGDDTLDSDGSVVSVDLTDNNYTIDSGFYTPEGGGSNEPTKPSEPGTPTEPTKPTEPTTPPVKGNLELGDKVWFDTDKDGVQDTDEKGIEGVTVSLVKPDGTIVTTTTDKDGKYLFTGLIEGDYTVYFNTPAGMIPTGLNVGDDMLDSDGSVVTVHLTDNNYTIDSGFYTPEGRGSTEPSTPNKPGEPTEPTTPSKPGELTEPTPPSTPGVPTSNNTLTSLPDTGKNNNTGLLATMFAGLGGVLLLKKRREENDDTEKGMK
ncbi:LPXTG cell wall anchor domain-containing protein, partial [Macrococcoides goetzii]